MRTIFISLGLILLTIPVLGQRGLFVGFTNSLTYDHYEFTDPANIIHSTLLPSWSWGFTVTHALNNHWLVETGLTRKNYYEGYSVSDKSIVSGGSGNSFDSWLIPIRLKSILNISKNKLFIVPIVGLNYAINSDYGYGLGYGSSGFSSTNSNSVKVSYIEDVNLRKHFLLLETGLGFDYIVTRNIHLIINFSYLNGFTKVSQIEYQITQNNGHVTNAYAHSNGDYLSIAITLNYNLSSLWTK